jgi:hypothetical protein
MDRKFGNAAVCQQSWLLLHAMNASDGVALNSPMDATVASNIEERIDLSSPRKLS